MKLALSFILLLPFLSIVAAENVTYDGRSLIINGTRRLIVSTTIHYTRIMPEMWPEAIRLAKEGGANTIDTYVFWNVHEIEPDIVSSTSVWFFKYNFAGRNDLVRFVKLVQEAGLFLMLRIGPFIGAEWNYGGIPVWLHYIPGTAFRTESASFKIENEYGHLQGFYGVGHNYSDWAARMAVSKDIGVPWIMCREGDALDPVIDTVNDFYGDYYHPNSVNKPKIWTEAWTGWIQTHYEPVFHRPTQDLAFAAARFFQKGGSVINYYMFGRTSGGTSANNFAVITSYDYDAPVDEYGLLRYPNYGHIKEFNEAIKLCENPILTAKPTQISLGPQQEGAVWSNVSSGECVAFLVNVDDKKDATVVFRNASYHLPAWSVSILPDCKNVVFNTAKVSSQTTVPEMVPEDLKPSPEMCMEEKDAGGDSSSSLKWQNPLKWEVFVEKAGIWGKEADLVYNGLVDQLNVTKDASDYLWYTTSEEFMKDGSQLALVIQFQSHHLHAFVNGELLNKGENETLRIPVALRAGRNEISVLNSIVGLPSAGAFFEWINYGPSSVKLEGFNNGTIGMEGEKLEIYKPGSTGNVTWNVPSEVPKMQPVTWYKVIVEEPSGDEPIGLDMLNMGKGSAWLNGQQIGRYWLQRSGEHEQCVSHGEEGCDYRGYMYPDKCRTGCGEPTQRWYHIPRSWFKPCGNLLVIFEEEGGDPTAINFSKRRTSRLCASVAEDHPPLGKAMVHLRCPENRSMDNILFASFGTPTGYCGSFNVGDYHDVNSLSVVEKVKVSLNLIGFGRVELGNVSLSIMSL
ncbi:unnamed protein product [Linum tenue]|uniref:beta-galactosidase n=1 Tax=Linum tenue TaxID=586396 RepID=A0AAV0PCR2_9ROSI|nr:unnamed protein product [Linum tenue]